VVASSAHLVLAVAFEFAVLSPHRRFLVLLLSKHTVRTLTATLYLIDTKSFTEMSLATNAWWVTHAVGRQTQRAQGGRRGLGHPRTLAPWFGRLGYTEQRRS